MGRCPQYLNPLDRQSRFLARFAQRRVDRSAVGWLDAPSGKADLPRVGLQMPGPARQQHAQLVVVPNQRHQHCWPAWAVLRAPKAAVRRT